MENPDMQLGVEFIVRAVQNPRKTKEAGRPIFDDREYVRIRFPADNKRELVAPAHEKHYVAHAKTQMTYAQRFQGAYKAFKDNRDMEFVEGTPLAELTVLTEAKRAELRAQNVKTVEQLAGLPDPAMKRLGMGARDLVKAAQTYLEKAEGMSEVAALKARIAELEAASQPAAEEPSPLFDEFDGMTDDDLKNMIRDAGGQVPKGRAGRNTLIKVLRDIADQKEGEAA